MVSHSSLHIVLNKYQSIVEVVIVSRGPIAHVTAAKSSKCLQGSMDCKKVGFQNGMLGQARET